MQPFQSRQVFMPGVIISLLLCLVLLRPPLSAAESHLNLHTLIEETKPRNQEIQVAQQRWEAVRALIPHVQEPAQSHYWICLSWPRHNAERKYRVSAGWELQKKNIRGKDGKPGIYQN